MLNKEIEPPSRRSVQHTNPKLLKKLAIAFAIVIVGLVVYLNYLAPHTLEAKQRKQLESTQVQLRETQMRLNETQTKNAQERAAKEKQLEEIQKKLNEADKALQAKRSTPKLDVAVASPVPVQPIFKGGGNKEEWLRASGIPEQEWAYVDILVSRESGWNPCAYNPGKSDCNANPTSACGLAQSLPCGKQSKYGHWTDPVANLKWQYDYVRGRYGGYAQTVAFWNANHWY